MARHEEMREHAHSSSSGDDAASPSRVTAPHGFGIALLALALGGFALGTAEFAAMGLLPDIAHGLGVTVPKAGAMISAYAVGVVIGAPLVTVVFAKFPRKSLMIGLMVVYAIGNGLTVCSSSFGLAVASRFIAGLPHGAYFGLAALTAASMVPTQKRGAAIAKMMLGLSAANVIGVPAATWLGQGLGWHSCFAVVASIAAVCAVMVAYTVPSQPAPENATPWTELGAFRRPQVLLTLLASAIGFGGVFAAYTYAASTLTHVTHVATGTVPWALAVVGIGMVLGNMLCGWLSDRWLKGTMVGMYAFSVAVLIAYVFVAPYRVGMLAALFGIGIGSSISPAFQARLIDVAGDAQSLAAALNQSAFNVANAMGAWLGGMVIAAGWGWSSTGWVGAALAAGGIMVLLTSFGLDARASRRRTA